jgi:hypothetical protein
VGITVVFLASYSSFFCCASMEVGHLASGKNATTPPGKDIIKPNQEE